ncbi:MAG: hypothetical protein ACK5GU_05420 [Chloroflexota bacterium]|jgi:hypothetical protein
MSSKYLEMVRNQRRRPSTFQFTSKTLLAILAVIAMGGSAAYWWGVQSQLTDNRIVAIAFTAILVLAPPSLVSFLIPWSPAGMLLQKINARTWGYPVIIGAALYLIYYSFQIQWSWWAAQPIVADAGLVYQQVLIGIIGFIVIPALLWTPVSSDELVEQVRQAHLVKRYELQTQADIAILRATLLRAQEKALIGFANLTIQERQELAAVMRSLVGGIDNTLREMGQTVRTVSGVAMPFDGLLEDNTEVRDVLDYITESLESSALGVDDEQVDVHDGDEPNQPARLAEPRADQQMQRGQAVARRSNQYHPRDEE